MVKFEVQLDGFKEFESQIQELAKGYRSDLVARNTLAKAGKVAMQPVYDYMAIAPYDAKGNRTGIHLRDTRRIDSRIPYESDRDSMYVKDTDAVITVVSVKKSAVSLGQEFGTAKMNAQPYLRVSLEATVDQVLSILKSQLGQIIPDYWASLRRRKIK